MSIEYKSMNIVSELVVGHVILGTYEVNVSCVIKMSGCLGPVPLVGLGQLARH